MDRCFREFRSHLDLPPGRDPMEAARRSFLAANALCAAIEDLPGFAERATGAPALEVKWPNDVLLDGGKVAGILLESCGNAQRVEWLAIGFGVNLAHAPEPEPGAAFAPTSLPDAGFLPPEPTSFLRALKGRYAEQEQLLAQRGFEAVRDQWLARAAKLGDQITARMAHESISGRFETIDIDGNLILQTDATRRAISAAEIFF